MTTMKDGSDEFIQSNSKWIRVLAGPGTGKSYCLKERIKYLVNDLGVNPERILVLSFTSIAAQDLRNDIIKLNLGDIETSTLHSLALKILAREKKNQRLLLDFESDAMLRDLEPGIGKLLSKKNLLKSMHCKNDAADFSEEEKAFIKTKEKWLKLHRGMIIDDVIDYLNDYLEHNETARKRVSYDHIIVDEYQDLNPAEQKLVEQLLSKRGKLSVIGDDDQSIYEFKGADPNGIRNFITTHPGCDDIRFSLCRRCPSSVVDYANKLIKHNKKRIDKEFFPKNRNTDIPCKMINAQTPEEEIKLLCDIIEDKNKSPQNGQIIVLAPTKARGKKLYCELNNRGIPASFCFCNIFDDKAAQENYSLLSLAANETDMISWRFLLGYGSKTANAASYRHILMFAKRNRRSVLDVLESCANGSLKIQYSDAIIKRYQEYKEKLAQIKEDYDYLLGLLGNHAKQYKTILDKALTEHMDRGGFPAVQTAVLEAAFSPENAAPQDSVRIMSLHAAKGLSAGMVIVMSTVEGLIPLHDKSIEEQRRLFYVAITRCKYSDKEKDKNFGKLVTSWFVESDDGMKDHLPSRFIHEMGIEIN